MCCHSPVTSQITVWMCSCNFHFVCVLDCIYLWQNITFDFQQFPCVQHSLANHMHWPVQQTPSITGTLAHWPAASRHWPPSSPCRRSASCFSEVDCFRQSIYISGIVQYLSLMTSFILFSIMSLRSIHVVAYDRSSFFFLRLNNLYVYTHACAHTHPPHFLYSFFRQWTFRLFLPLSYSE